MNNSNNERSTPGPVLRVGLVATEDVLAHIASAINACARLSLVAQSGMPQSAALPGPTWIDDTRVLIEQQELDAVLLATSPARNAELATIAARRGLHVWRTPPLARTFAEAVEIVRTARQSSTLYRVSSWWDYIADQVWHNLDWPPDFSAALSTIRFAGPGPTIENWAAGTAEAAGGVLACGTYPLLEGLIATRGLPESLSAAIHTFRQQPTGVLRTTEDAALAILHYASDGIGTITATWDTPHAEFLLAHHGPTAGVTLHADEIELTHTNNNLTDRQPLPTEHLAHELHQFTDWIQTAARDRATAPLDRHLAVSALIETVYLAARTHQPESPRKLYSLQGCPAPSS